MVRTACMEALMFDNEGNEIYHPLVEGYDYLIRRHEVLGRLRLPPGDSETFQLELQFIGNHLPLAIRFDDFPMVDVIGVLCEAQKLVRINSDREDHPWIGSMTFHWPE